MCVCHMDLHTYLPTHLLVFYDDDTHNKHQRHDKLQRKYVSNVNCNITNV